jgi:branched-chain amino acid transport system substrate-binding protein
MRNHAALTLAAVTLLLLAACGSGSDESSTDSEAFRVGLEAPQSGDQAVLGEGMLRGAELAADRINAAGGISGRDVEIVPIDDAADPETGVEAAEAAIDDGLDGVIGPYNSSVGEETLPLYIEAGLVPIRLTSDISTNGQGLTLQPMTDQIAPVASRALTDWLDSKTVAIAYDPTPGYTLTVAEAVKRSLEKAGVEVTAYEQVKPGKDDYAALVDRVSAGEPDVIYAVVYFPEGGLIAKEIHERDLQSQCVADYASYDTGFVETAGVAAARACPVVGVPAPADFKGSNARLAEYREKFGEEPGTWSPYTYDSLNFLGAGIEAAGGTDAAALEKALKGLKGWRGWTGSVSIDPETGNRDPATVVIARAAADGGLHVDRGWAMAVGAPY